MGHTPRRACSTHFAPNRAPRCHPSSFAKAGPQGGSSRSTIDSPAASCWRVRRTRRDHCRSRITPRAETEAPRDERRRCGLSGHCGLVHGRPGLTQQRHSALLWRRDWWRLAAMAGLGRDTSRSPDRTGVWCAGLGTLSAQEMTTGRVSHQQISSIKEEIVIYRPNLGPDSLRDALRVTFVGNHREPSGKSRLRRTGVGTEAHGECFCQL